MYSHAFGKFGNYFISDDYTNSAGGYYRGWMFLLRARENLKPDFVSKSYENSKGGGGEIISYHPSNYSQLCHLFEIVQGNHGRDHLKQLLKECMCSGMFAHLGFS